MNPLPQDEVSGRRGARGGGDHTEEEGGGWQQVKPLQLDGGVPPLGQRRQKETPLSLKLFLALRGLLTHVVVVVYLFD